MTTACAPTPITRDVSSLIQSFTAWVEKSAVGTNPKQKTLPVFSLNDATATLDATRASNLIRSGVRAGNAGDLVALLGLAKKEDLSGALNTNNVSLWRWAKLDKSLPGATVEQILRAMHLQIFAAEVFGSLDLARKWLHKPHPSLDGVSPMDFSDNEFGAQKVRGMLAGLKYGGVV